MRNLWSICWFLWEGLPTIFAFPVDYNQPTGTGDSWSSYWELKWPRYAIGTLGFVVVALTLAGCMCCRRQRRPKGFQDDAGNGKEFKDGSTAATETSIERVASSSLELEVARIQTSQSSSNKVQFEVLPIDRLSVDVRASKPKPPSPSLFSDNPQTPENINFSNFQPCRDWFAGNSHVPRERLKYHREIGRGWFGKVVEGTAEIPDNSDKKNRGVVVRILTEEATNSEKNWFLGEATPYFKLNHPNILTLLGSCLETDPYLLLFESCPAGDLKSFLIGNRDKGTCEALKKENVPTRMALDIANALEHMHNNGFAHTDLSARNCLVATDLSAKLGDYGTGVEKYPGDYYVVGDRALPIRWSAPESLNCTETTIETRTITHRANLWSFAVLIWEIATWGERPFDDLEDEQVIEMIFSLKTSFFAQRTCEILIKKLREEFDAPLKFREAIEASWKFLPDDRASLKQSKEILEGKTIEDFEKRWKNLKPNAGNLIKERDNRSASLQDLRGSVDEQIWDDKNSVQPQFRLGPEEIVKNFSSVKNSCFQESGSETEEESWRGRVERGVYTEKVKQKSKSVADLMILVHIESDSEAEVSLGPQISEKTMKKKLPSSGSDGDLKSHNFDDEFDEAIRKLRDNSVSNGKNVKTTINQSENLQFVDNIDKPKLMTLTHQGQTPILRLCFGFPENKENSNFHDDQSINLNETENYCKNNSDAFSTEEKDSGGFDNVFNNDKSTKKKYEENLTNEEIKISSQTKIEGPVLRLVSKGDPQLPVLSYVTELNSKPQETINTDEKSSFDSFLVFETPQSNVVDLSKKFQTSSSQKNSKIIEDDSLDVELWNNALAYELEKKNPGFEAHGMIFDETNDFSRENVKESKKKSLSAPNTPKSVNFKLEINAQKDFSSSAPETPKKNDFRTKKDGNNFEDVNRCENNSEKHHFQPEDVKISSKNSFSETIENVYSDEKIEEKSVKKVDQPQDSFSVLEIREKPSEIHEESSKNVNQLLGSFSAPETPEKRYFPPETSLFYQDLPLGSSSTPKTPENHNFAAKIVEKSSKNINQSSSLPETRENHNFASKTEEKSSKNDNQSSSLPETPENHNFASKTEEKSSKNINQSSSLPETPENHYFALKTEENSSKNVNQSSSVPETPEKHYFHPEIDETSSKVSYYENLALGSSSAPETPEKHYFHPKIDETSSKVSYYENLALGSSSAPETPGNHYFDSKVDKKSPKNINYYTEILGSTSAPETPQFRGNYSVRNCDEDSSTCEDLLNTDRIIIKRTSHEVDDEEDRKHLSTPDDERSSDSGFRDKESCEEEESPVPCPSASSIISGVCISSSELPVNSSPLSASAEEEQMRILFELDTILDAEYYGSFRDSEKLDESDIFSPNSLLSRTIDGEIVSTKNRSISESLESTESTDVVETVRANSCEPDFLDSRNLRGITTLKNEEDDKIISVDEVKKLGDFLKKEAEDCDYFVVANSDDTEADFLADSASESLKYFEDFSDNVRKDSGDFSTKNDSKSWDSSAELRRLNVDSLSDGKFDKSNDSNDFSIELRSSDVSEFNKSKITDSNSESPIKSDKISSNDFSIDGTNNPSEILQIERKTGHLVNLDMAENPDNNFLMNKEKREKDLEICEADELENSSSYSDLNKDKQNEDLVICRELSDSKNQLPIKSERRTEKSEICQVSIDFENSTNDASLKSEKNSKTSEICEDSVEFENSASNSLLKIGENKKCSKLCEDLVELEKSTSDSSVKSENNSKSSELCEASVKFEKFASNFSVKSENNSKTSDLCEVSVEFEKSASNSSVKNENNSKTSELCEVSVEFEKSASNSSVKNENNSKTSELCEVSVEFEKSASNSSVKSENNSKTSELCEASVEFEKTSELCEASVEFEKSAGNSSVKSENNSKTSELCEISVEFEKSAGNSSVKSENNSKTSELCEVSVEFEKSAGNSSVKSENNIKTSELCEVSVEFEKSAGNSSVKSENNSKNSELCQVSVELEKSADNSSVKSETTNKTSEMCEASVEFENSAFNFPLKSEKDNKSPEINEALIELKNSAANSSFKTENANKTSKISQTSVEHENLISKSSLKSEKYSETPETSKISPKFENSAASSQKVSKTLKSSEKFECSKDLKNSSSNSPKKFPKPPESPKKSLVSTDFDNSHSTSPKKISNPEKTSEPMKTTQFENPSSHSSKKSSKLQKTSEPIEISREFGNSSLNTAKKLPKFEETYETSEIEIENSPIESPIKIDRNQISDLSIETREPENVNSDVDQWSSRENINENDNDDEDSSTMSLRSDNSYVSFGLDEEFVAAIRNELREKLPRAQMPVIETLDPRDEKEPSINKNAETKRWEEEEEAEENAERTSGTVDIAIRYNIYGTPLSPILEERESAATSESLISKEDSRDDASIASRISALSEDVLVVDTRTNKALMLEANFIGNEQKIDANLQLDEDRDTSHGDFSDEENLEYPQNHLNRGLENKRICMGSGGAPLPSPEEETKWQQQFPLPLQMQDDLMSTSFGTDRDWDSQDDDEGEEGEDGEEDEEENSSSSGEFVWKRYDESHGDLENVATRSPPNKPKSHEPEADLEEEDEGDDDEEEEEEEFTPSAWDATLAPHRSALRSPEKTLKSGDQKKSVWFKKQRYHCVYEYPKETPVAESQGQTATTWEPTSYADWEEMMDEPRLDVYPMEYDESNRAGDEEFYVSSSNRPFQFQTGEGKYVSQFFPGASSTLLQQQQQQPEVPHLSTSEDFPESQDEVDRVEAPSSPHFPQSNGNSQIADLTETEKHHQQQQKQLGELRHTRDRLKLNLLSSTSSTKTEEDLIENRDSEIEISENPEKNLSKTFSSTSSTSEDREKKIDSEKSIDLQNQSKDTKNEKKSEEKMIKKYENLPDDFLMQNKISDNLDVKKTTEVAIYDEQDDKQISNDRQSISGDNCKDNEIKNSETLLGDDFTVIQDGNEILSENNYSESIAELNKTIELPISISTNELTVEKIVDIPKLETEECPKVDKEFGDKNCSDLMNKDEISRIRNVVTSTEDVKIDEKMGINVQPSKS